MQDTGLKQKKRKNKHKTTDSKHKLDTYENLIKSIVPSYPNHIWATDITYVRLLKGFCYVAMIIDVFTKKIVGWNIKLTMETVLVKEALEYALQNGCPEYHHSDRGKQYCAHEYVNELKKKKIKISMADRGVSVDNAYAESFFRTLKVEEVYIKNYDTIEDAKKSIKQFIEIVYNKKRLHSSLKYVPPEEFESEWLLKNKGRVLLKVLEN